MCLRVCVILQVICKNADVLNSSIIYHRDFDYDYFGFKTLEACFLIYVPAP